MKKGFILIIAVLLLAAGFYYFGYRNTAGSEEAKVESAVAEEAAASDLPWLPIVKADGSRLVVKDLKGKTVLVLFQPDCDHCQREAVQIRENLSHFDGYQLYFVSDAALPQISQFAKEYELEGIRNIHFAQASVNDIIYTVGPVPSPSLFVYSENGRLVKDFKGETPVEQIIPYL